MSAREPKLPVVREGLGPLIANNDRARRASRVNLILPCEQSREPQRAEGAPRNTPPKSSHLSPTMGTREIPGRMVTQKRHPKPMTPYKSMSKGTLDRTGPQQYPTHGHSHPLHGA